MTCHGKPRKMAKYAYSPNTTRAVAISSEQYEYYGLGESVQVMDENKQIYSDVIGEEIEMYAEMKEVRDLTLGASVGADYTWGISQTYPMPAVVPLPIFMNLTEESLKAGTGSTLGASLSASYDENILRTHVLTKCIAQTGILKRTTSEIDGVRQVTDYQVFDKYTGSPVVTHTYDDFNKNYTNQNICAAWDYEGMRPNYQNEERVADGLKLIQSNGDYFLDLKVSGQCGELDNFVRGDLLQLGDANSQVLMHVDEVDQVAKRIKLLPSGYSASATSLVDQNIRTKVLRSGFTNELGIQSGGIVYHENAEVYQNSALSTSQLGQIDALVSGLNQRLSPSDLSFITLKDVIPDIKLELNGQCIQGSDIDLSNKLRVTTSGLELHGENNDLPAISEKRVHPNESPEREQRIVGVIESNNKKYLVVNSFLNNSGVTSKVNFLEITEEGEIKNRKTLKIKDGNDLIRLTASAIKKLQNGDFIITGICADLDLADQNHHEDLIVIKLDSDLNVLKARRYPQSEFNSGFDIGVYSNDDLLITAYSGRTNRSTGFDFRTLRIDLENDTQPWDIIYEGGARYDLLNKVSPLGNDQFLVVGLSSSVADNCTSNVNNCSPSNLDPSGARDIVWGILDNTGNISAMKYLNYPGDQQPKNVIKNADNSHTIVADDNGSLIVIKLNAQGVYQWGYRYRASINHSNIEIKNASPTTNNGVNIYGSFNTKLFKLTLSNTGVVTSLVTYSTSAGGTTSLFGAITINNDEIIYGNSSDRLLFINTKCVSSSTNSILRSTIESSGGTINSTQLFTEDPANSSRNFSYNTNNDFNVITNELDLYLESTLQPQCNYNGLLCSQNIDFSGVNYGQAGTFITGGDQFYFDQNSQKLLFGNPNDPCGSELVTCINVCPNNSSETLTNVITASATTFDDNWEFNEAEYTGYQLYGSTIPNFKTGANAYELGKKGNWRPKEQFVYRRPIDADNTLVYKNFNRGKFELTMFDWQNEGANDPTTWVKTNTISQYTPNGEPIEDKNILDIYSTSEYGYNHTLPTLVAQNASKGSVAYESFEEETYFPHTLVTLEKHTGKKAVEIQRNTALKIAPIQVNQQIKNEGLMLRTWVKNSFGPDALNKALNVTWDNGNGSTGSIPMYKISGAGEWILYETIIAGAQLKQGTQYTFSLLIDDDFAGQTAFVDDVRIQPVQAEMVCYVYDEAQRLTAVLDDQHFAMIYQYNTEGLLVRKKKETIEGVKTISETQYNSKGQERKTFSGIK